VARKREYRGIQLLARGNSVRQVDESNFLVCSESDSNKEYRVMWKRDRWVCSCPDYIKNSQKCKHIYAACYYLDLRDITRGIGGLGEGPPRCPKCGSAEQIIKRGKRYNRCGPVQRCYCKRCRIRFSDRAAFEGIKSKTAAVIVALDLYYRGLSLRQISEHLEASHGIKVTHGTVYYWIKKYVELVNRYVKSLRAKTSERWHADETLVRVRGRHLVLWALLDGETRFLIATRVSQSRGEEDAYAVMKNGLEKCEGGPSEFVTDGLSSYSAAIGRISEKNRPLIHLQGPLIESLNNKMERFFGTVKNRTKTMCRFDSEEGAERFAEGFGAYYNFVKPHKALGGKTPAQVAGLTRKKYNWLDLILAARKCSSQRS